MQLRFSTKICWCNLVKIFLQLERGFRVIKIFEYLCIDRFYLYPKDIFIFSPFEKIQIFLCLIMIYYSLTDFLLMRSNQRLALLLLRRRLEVGIYSYNSLSIFIISDRKYLLFTSWNKWKFNSINFLHFFSIYLLLYLLIPLTFIVILLH